MNRLIRSAPSRTLSALFTCSLIALVGCKSTDADTAGAQDGFPKRAEISQELNAVAEVTAVDRAKRVVTLKREDGALFALAVPDAARNFDQIEVGDKVRARYKVSLAASILPEGETAQAAQGVAGAARSKAGDKPGGGVGVAASARVKVESIDLARDIVTLSLGSGELVSHRLATPEGREFAKGLKVGDIVQVDYAEALALSVEAL